MPGDLDAADPCGVTALGTEMALTCEKPSFAARVAQDTPLAQDRFSAGLLDARSHRESSTARRNGASTPHT